MRRFVLKTLCILMPFLLIPVMYVIYDPLNVIWDYDDIGKYPSRNVASNTYKIMTKYDSIPYNSFIVGSSRSGFWPTEEWEKYLDSLSCPLHLEQSGDGLFNALQRLEFVYSHVEHVRNILLVIDKDWLKKDYLHKGIQYRNPWQMTSPKDYFAFQKDAWDYFFSIEGFKAHYKIGEQYKIVFPCYRDGKNEPHEIGREWAITYDPEYYYNHLISPEYLKLYPRDSIEKVGEPVITQTGRELLSRIHELFLNGETKYKIVINPLFDQIKLNPMDKLIIDSIFGYDNVYDYSGSNRYTKDTLNYYENSHYRPRVAVWIMKDIYTE